MYMQISGALLLVVCAKKDVFCGQLVLGETNVQGPFSSRCIDNCVTHHCIKLRHNSGHFV